MQQAVELLGLHAQHGLFLGDHALVHQVDGDLQGGGGGALAVAGLQHVELAVFDGELHILHVAVVVFEVMGDALELLVHRGHILFQFGDGAGRAHAGHNVFALSIDEVLAKQGLFAGGGVAGEGDAGAGVFIEVAEHHRLHVDGGAPAVGDVVHAAIDVGAGVVPGAEHGLDGLHQLRLGVGGEVRALLLVVVGLEAGDKLLHVVDVQLDILGDALGFLDFVDDDLKGLLGDLHHHVGEHLDEAAVGVVDEALELGIGVAGDEASGHFVVEAEVEDGVHHARHGSARAGAHGNQQRVLIVAELLAVDLLDLDKSGVDLLLNVRADGLAIVVVAGAGFGGDGEALRHRHTQRGHFREVGALAAQEVAHGGVALAEEVDILCRHGIPP